jgi:hypothetical protein
LDGTNGRNSHRIHGNQGEEHEGNSRQGTRRYNSQYFLLLWVFGFHFPNSHYSGIVGIAVLLPEDDDAEEIPNDDPHQEDVRKGKGASIPAENKSTQQEVSKGKEPIVSPPPLNREMLYSASFGESILGRRINYCPFPCVASGPSPSI